MEDQQMSGQLKSPSRISEFRFLKEDKKSQSEE